MNRQIILASASPRRTQLLSLLGIRFKAVDSGFKEIINQNISPQKLVQTLALGKAKAAAKKYPKAVIIAADTVVVFKGSIYGKPKTKAEAAKMLKSFSGQPQNVISGLVVLDSKTKKFVSTSEKTTIHFRKLSGKEIRDYVATGEPMDRAGAYAFQHSGFNLTSKLEGDITVSIGMPMTALYNALKEFKVKF